MDFQGALYAFSALDVSKATAVMVLRVTPQTKAFRGHILVPLADASSYLWKATASGCRNSEHIFHLGILMVRKHNLAFNILCELTFFSGKERNYQEEVIQSRCVTLLGTTNQVNSRKKNAHLLLCIQKALGLQNHKKTKRKNGTRVYLQRFCLSTYCYRNYYVCIRNLSHYTTRASLPHPP